jgi:hypothetical protein
VANHPSLVAKDMPNIVSAIDGTSHEIQIPSIEPQQKPTFSKPIIFID